MWGNVKSFIGRTALAKSSFLIAFFPICLFVYFIVEYKKQ